MNRGRLLVTLVLVLARSGYAQKLPVRAYGVSEGLPHEEVRRIVADSRGFMWFCTHGGLGRFDGERFITYDVNDGLPVASLTDLLESRDGSYWIATDGGGVVRFNPATPRRRGTVGGLFKRYSLGSEVASNLVVSVYEDRRGNIWAGTPDKGVIRIAKDGLISYGEEEGVTNPEVIQIYEGRHGELYAISSKWSIHRFDGERFITVRPNLPRHIFDSSSGRWWIIQDRTGEWWVGTIEGLYRFPSVKRLEDLSRTTPRAVYTTRDGLPDNNINRLYEDSRGDIWISSYNPPGLVTRWERATGTFQVYSQAHGMPPLNWNNVFGEDSSGDVWLGLHNGGVARLRQDRFEVFDESAGVPGGMIQGLYRDRGGGLWIATSAGGAARIADPGAANPLFRPYRLEQGLSSNNLRCFVEDAWGRVYFGTAKGSIAWTRRRAGLNITLRRRV